MWKLESYRIISSIAGWLPIGRFYDVRDMLTAARQSYGNPSITFRATCEETGITYAVNFVETDDENDSDYVVITAELGEVKRDWPQYCGDVNNVNEFKALCD